VRKVIIPILAVWLFPFGIASWTARGQASPPRQAPVSGSGLVKEGQAIVWYLGHCGYAVRTRTKLLIFDYSKTYGRRGDPAPEAPARPSLSNGWIDPREIKNMDVVVFVTHSHADHFSRVIRDWEAEIPGIQYVFGWDAGRAANVHSLPAPRAGLRLDGLTVATVNSDDGVPGSAFLVRVDGLTLFFGGDYYGGPRGVRDDLTALQIKPGEVDLLFTEAGLTPTNEALIKALEPKAIFPNHRGGHEGEYKTFAGDLMRSGIGIPVACPEGPGRRFEYGQGRALRDPSSPPSIAGPFLPLVFDIEEHDKERDLEILPDRVKDAIGLRPGMIVGEAGAWYGYYTFKLSRWVGPEGRVYANDINPAALREIEERCAAGKVANVDAVLGLEDDPRFPRTDLDCILVGDCFHMFTKRAEWLAHAQTYLKPGGRLIILDPDTSKMIGSAGFLSRRQVRDLGERAGYTVIDADDAFLPRHMIVIFQRPTRG